MAETLAIHTGTKEEQYKSLLPQIKALIADETDLIANLANIGAALQAQFNWFWTGFYLVKGNSLVVGPFQGPIACTRIAKGRGVCGGCWEKKETLIVKDVNQFQDHIACNSASQSEIVVPIIRNGVVVAVLDIDSAQLNTFDQIDKKYLEQLVAMIPFTA